MASQPLPVPSVAPTSAPTPDYRATVETVDDYESVGAHVYSVSNISSGTSLASLNSVLDVHTDDDDDEVEEIKRPAELAKEESAEVMTSLWGLIPPKNFGQVMPGIYRSAFPSERNLTFLRALGLKSILTIVYTAYPDKHVEFVKEEGIEHFRVHLQSNKDPFASFCQETMNEALKVVFKRANHPLLIHCNRGKHRTGCVVGCLRKISGWTLSAAVQEYRSYAGAKARFLDERFMEFFDEEAVAELAKSQGLIPSKELASDLPVSAITDHPQVEKSAPVQELNVSCDHASTLPRN